MGIILIIILVVVIIVIISKNSKNSNSNKINQAKVILGNKYVSEKYQTVVNTISSIDHYFEEYDIHHISPVQDNICSRRYPNVMIMMSIYNNLLYLEWGYIFYQKKVSRSFSHALDNFDEKGQEKFAISSYKTMDQVIREHQTSVNPF